MKQLFTNEERERMTKLVIKAYYESMQEDSRFEIADVPEYIVKMAIREWLSEMDDSDFQVCFGKACAMVVDKAMDQAAEEDC